MGAIATTFPAQVSRRSVGFKLKGPNLYEGFEGSILGSKGLLKKSYQTAKDIFAAYRYCPLRSVGRSRQSKHLMKRLVLVRSRNTTYLNTDSDGRRTMKQNHLVRPLLIILFASGLSWAQDKLSIAQQNSNDASVLNDRGIEHIKAVRYTEAVEDFKKSIALKDDFAPAYNNLGMAYNLLGRRNQARIALIKAITIDPMYAEAYFNLGVLNDNERRYQDAVECLNRAISLKPDFARAQNSLGVAYSDWAKHSEAIKAYKRAIQIKPDYAEAYNNLGTTEVELGRLEDAISSFGRAIELKAKLTVARYNLGVAYLKMKNREAALEQQRLLRVVDVRLANKLYDGLYRGKVLHVTLK